MLVELTFGYKWLIFSNDDFIRTSRDLPIIMAKGQGAILGKKQVSFIWEMNYMEIRYHDLIEEGPEWCAGYYEKPELYFDKNDDFITKSMKDAISDKLMIWANTPDIYGYTTPLLRKPRFHLEYLKAKKPGIVFNTTQDNTSFIEKFLKILRECYWNFGESYRFEVEDSNIKETMSDDRQGRQQ